MRTFIGLAVVFAAGALTGCADGPASPSDGRSPATRPAQGQAKAPNPVWAVGFSPDGELLAAALGWGKASGPPWGGDGEVLVWNTTQWQPYAAFREGFTYYPESVCFSPDGKTLAAGVKRYDKSVTSGSVIPRKASVVRFWSVPDKRELAPLELPPEGGSPWFLEFSRVGDRLLVGADGVLGPYIYDVQAKKELPLVKGIYGILQTGWAFSPDGKSILAAQTGSKFGPDKKLQPEDKREKPSLRLYDASSGEQTARRDLQDVQLEMRVAFAPSGKQVAAGLTQGRVLLLSASLDKELADIRIGADPVRAVAYAPEGPLLAAVCEGKVFLIDTEAKKVVKTLDEYHGRVSCVAFAPGGKKLAIGCEREPHKPEPGAAGAVVVVSVPDGKVITTLRP